MPIQAVLFDLDGTIASFNLDYKALRGDVREYLMQVGIPASQLVVNESIFEMMKKAEVYLKKNSKTGVSFLKARTYILGIAEKYELEAAQTTNLLPGALDALKELKRMNLKVGLCTTSSEKAANYILNRFKIKENFQVIIPRNKVKHVKPDTEQFELALKTLEVKAGAAVIVGDSTVDMQSAKELKSVAVGLSTGYSTIKELTAHGANYLITSLSDLPTLIKKLNQ
jgi:HAD superfamily hydrolase (TIGR01509 family)